MNLYLLSTDGLGDFHVLGESPDVAQNKLLNMLNLADYGVPKNRRVLTIHLVAEQVTELPKGKPDFSTGNRLIL